MWTVEEHDALDRKWQRLPRQVLKKYELWKSLVRYNGPQILRTFPGFHDESLKGTWRGFRSSRLNIQYRVIYRVMEQGKCVRVDDIVAHTY
ncbi:MAG: type II toxin-antitoxin system mRNA interferase toxin, RelE/StbE family [Deltaproteobacteria bacterium]|nr:type II toxin-antitoxin system mRNA interferase toxin, RelE/StbE family [Deltaproteobacteria bacterium]